MTIVDEKRKEREFNEDGINLRGYEKPVLDRFGVKIFETWRKERRENIIWLVIFPGLDGGNSSSYHDDQSDSYKDAFRRASRAIRVRDHNNKNHKAVQYQVASWIKFFSPTFTKSDAQDAGFCRLGVEEFFGEMKWGDVVTADQVLKHYDRDTQSFSDPRISMVAYHAHASLVVTEQ